MRDFAEAIVPIIGMIVTFGIPGILIFWYMYTKNKERMKLIEKGFTPEEIKSIYKAEVKAKTRSKRNPISALKWGLLLIFAGVGFVMGNILEELYDLGDGASFGVTLIWGGIGVILYYLMAKRQYDKENAIDKASEYKVNNTLEV